MNLIKAYLDSLTDENLEVLDSVTYVDSEEIKMEFYVHHDPEHKDGVKYEVYCTAKGLTWIDVSHGYGANESHEVTLDDINFINTLMIDINYCANYKLA